MMVGVPTSPFLFDEAIFIKQHVHPDLALNWPRHGCPLCPHMNKVINIFEFAGQRTHDHCRKPGSSRNAMSDAKYHILRPSTFHPWMGYMPRLIHEIPNCMNRAPCDVLMGQSARS